MSDFILVWVLMTYGSHSPTYSPPVQNLDDCKRMQKFVEDNTLNRTQCVQINILRTKK